MKLGPWRRDRPKARPANVAPKPLEVQVGESVEWRTAGAGTTNGIHIQFTLTSWWFIPNSLGVYEHLSSADCVPQSLPQNAGRQLFSTYNWLVVSIEPWAGHLSMEDMVVSIVLSFSIICGDDYLIDQYLWDESLYVTVLSLGESWTASFRSQGVVMLSFHRCIHRWGVPSIFTSWKISQQVETWE